MKNYLFLITVGPVQSFIAQARKAQDLYAGSQILSNLIQKGMVAFEGLNDEKDISLATIVFPQKQASNPCSYPNRLIGKLTLMTNSINLQRIGENIANAIQEEFDQIAANSLKEKQEDPPVDPKDLPPDFLSQLNRHLDIHWVFEPIDNDYQKAYLNLEKALGAVKNTRVFEQLNNGMGEQGRKCNLDGINNAVFYKDQVNGNQPSQIDLNKAKSIDNFLLNPGETLSAVSYVKRRFYQTQKFPSVAEVALLKATKELEDSFCLKAMNDICSISGTISRCIESQQSFRFDGNTSQINDQFDYQMVYPENINEKTFPHPTQRKLAAEIAKKLESKLKDKHYALVMFDGDKMGKWLSGAKTKHHGNDLEAYHKKLSSLLGVFAQKTRTILEGKGKVIYAGGDDFLGFVNLYYLFDVIKELRIQFNEQINARIEKDKNEGAGPFTFSAGIVIAHYKVPLSEVLKKVRFMEKRAKNTGNRNAFAVAAIRHSGEIQEAIFKWDYMEDAGIECSNWNDLEHIYSELRTGKFSSAFILNITRTINQLAGIGKGKLDKISYRSLKPEFKRLINRALQQRENPVADDLAINQLNEAVFRLFDNSILENKSQSFIHSLHIVDFMNRRTQKFSTK